MTDPITPERVTLTEGEREALCCDCEREDGDPHGHMCATGGEYNVLLSPDVLVGYVERILSDRLREAKADAWDRCHDDLCGNKDWAGACIYPVHANPYRETP